MHVTDTGMENGKKKGGEVFGKNSTFLNTVCKLTCVLQDSSVLNLREGSFKEKRIFL